MDFFHFVNREKEFFLNIIRKNGIQRKKTQEIRRRKTEKTSFTLSVFPSSPACLFPKLNYPADDEDFRFRRKQSA